MFEFEERFLLPHLPHRGSVLDQLFKPVDAPCTEETHQCILHVVSPTRCIGVCLACATRWEVYNEPEPEEVGGYQAGPVWIEESAEFTPEQEERLKTLAERMERLEAEGKLKMVSCQAPHGRNWLYPPGDERLGALPANSDAACESRIWHSVQEAGAETLPQTLPTSQYSAGFAGDRVKLNIYHHAEGRLVTYLLTEDEADGLVGQLREAREQVREYRREHKNDGSG